LNWLPNGSHVPYFYALDQRFFSEQGISVKILEGAGSNTSVKVVASSENTLGLASAASVILGRSKGAQVRAVAVFQQESPTCLIAAPGIVLRRPEDLYGLRMGVKLESSTYPAYLGLVEKFELDRSQIEEIGITQGLEALMSGRIDVMSGHTDNEPIQLRQMNHRVDVLTYRSLGIRLYGMALIASDDLLTSNPEVIRSFLRAATRGWEHSAREPERAVSALLSRYPALDRETVTAQWQHALTLASDAELSATEFGWQDQRGWQDAMESLRLASLLSNSAVDPNEIYTNKFLPHE
jgi:NitT/TauT family transport system substrate-binding protein